MIHPHPFPTAPTSGSAASTSTTDLNLCPAAVSTDPCLADPLRLDHLGLHSVSSLSSCFIYYSGGMLRWHLLNFNLLSSFNLRMVFWLLILKLLYFNFYVKEFGSTSSPTLTWLIHLRASDFEASILQFLRQRFRLHFIPYAHLAHPSPARKGKQRHSSLFPSKKRAGELTQPNSVSVTSPASAPTVYSAGRCAHPLPPRR